MTDGNGWTTDKGRVEEILDQHTRRLGRIEAQVWALLLTFGAAVIAGVMAWMQPRQQMSESYSAAYIKFLVDERVQERLQQAGDHR